MHTYVFYHNFGSLDFGKPKFWLAMILVGQKLVANQSGTLFLSCMKIIACDVYLDLFEFLNLNITAWHGNIWQEFNF